MSMVAQLAACLDDGNGFWLAGASPLPTRSTPSPEKTLLAFANHGSLDDRHHADCCSRSRVS